MELLASCVMKMCLKPLGLRKCEREHNPKKVFVIEKNPIKLNPGHRGHKNPMKAEKLPGLSTLNKIILYARVIPKLDLRCLFFFLMLHSGRIRRHIWQRSRSSQEEFKYLQLKTNKKNHLPLLASHSWWKQTASSLDLSPKAKFPATWSPLLSKFQASGSLLKIKGHLRSSLDVPFSRDTHYLIHVYVKRTFSCSPSFTGVLC